MKTTTNNIRRIAVMSIAAAVVLLAAVSAPAVEKRPSDKGGLVYSLGLPSRNLAHAGFTAGAYRDGGENDFTAYGSLATYRDLIHPAYTVVGLWGGVYFGYRDEDRGDADGGFRAMIMAPAFKLGAGIDYNFLDQKTDAIISLMLPLRRGGVLGHGSMFRANWLPGRRNSWSVGIEVPLQRYAGKTRPAKDNVKFEKRRWEDVPYTITDPKLEEALANIRDSAHWINRLTVPFLDQKGFTETKGLSGFEKEIQAIKAHVASTSPLYPNGRTIHEEVRVYHSELDRAFSIAATGEALAPGESTELGRAIAALAREALFDEVILPYDRLLGQRKKNDSVMNLGPFARGEFARRVSTNMGIAEDWMDRVLYVFETLIEIVEENRKRSRDLWNDSRLVWIPMQYGLLPEQHDSQAEMDRLVERATDVEFTPGNEVYYIINEKFQFEVHKQILKAKDYHVLWVHDFRGIDGAGEPDEVSFAQVVDSYYRALIENVRNYDKTGKMPVYMIVQDQYYYENNKSRRWHTILMDPMYCEPIFPREYEWMGTVIDSVQKELREAVAQSELLQAQRREYGEKWLRDRIKVHVSITQPADESFWSDGVVPILGLHDNYVRDHRKISFYDVTEEDPYEGGAIFTGMGVGEHYVGATWEDRGILARGPSLVALKDALRELLKQNGFSDEQIPYPLRPKRRPANYYDMIAAGSPNGGNVRGLQLHNVVGFGQKDITVFKAMMYTLLPPGSVLLMPDFVWQSPVWSAMAVGGALRGTRSLIVFPSLRNQPAPSGIPQSRAREMFRRLIRVQHELADEIAANGGLLKTGFYNLGVDVKDLQGRMEKAVQSLGKYPFLSELMHRTPGTEAKTAQAVADLLESEGYEVFQYVQDATVRYPQLHMKAHFYASAESWDTFFDNVDRTELTTAYVRAWIHQLQNEESDPTEFQDELAPIIEKYEKAVRDLSAGVLDKAMTYLLVGSSNMSYRSTFLDGEVRYVSTRGGVLTGALDLLVVMQMSDWVDDESQLDEYMGSYGWLTRQLSRWATPLM